MEPKSRAQHQSRAQKPFQSSFCCSPPSPSSTSRPAQWWHPGLGSHWAPMAHAIAGLLRRYSAPPLGAGSALSPPETLLRPPKGGCYLLRTPWCFRASQQAPAVTSRHSSLCWALWAQRNQPLTLPWRHCPVRDTGPLTGTRSGGAHSGQQTRGKVLDLTSHQGNADPNHMRCHFSPTGATRSETGSDCGQGCGEISPVQCWGEWKTMWRCPTHVKCPEQASLQ